MVDRSLPWRRYKVEPLFIGRDQSPEKRFDDLLEFVNRQFHLISGALDVNADEAWEDLKFPSHSINLAGHSPDPDIDNTTFPGTLLFDTTTIELIGGVAMMPHDWMRGSAIRPHVHWSKTTSAAGGVAWEWCYSIADIGGTFGAYSSWVQATVATSDSDTANKHAVASFAELSMSSYIESAIILWQLRRNTGSAAPINDNYGADARLYSFDIHYQKDKNGTFKEFPLE